MTVPALFYPIACRRRLISSGYHPGVMVDKRPSTDGGWAWMVYACEEGARVGVRLTRGGWQVQNFSAARAVPRRAASSATISGEEETARPRRAGRRC